MYALSTWHFNVFLGWSWSAAKWDHSAIGRSEGELLLLPMKEVETGGTATCDFVLKIVLCFCNLIHGYDFISESYTTLQVRPSCRKEIQFWSLSLLTSSASQVETLNSSTVLSPSTNHFLLSGPFTKTVYSYMKLQNPSDKKVCFKIKTTAPER